MDLISSALKKSWTNRYFISVFFSAFKQSLANLKSGLLMTKWFIVWISVKHSIWSNGQNNMSNNYCIVPIFGMKNKMLIVFVGEIFQQFICHIISWILLKLVYNVQVHNVFIELIPAVTCGRKALSVYPMLNQVQIW